MEIQLLWFPVLISEYIQYIYVYNYHRNRVVFLCVYIYTYAICYNRLHIYIWVWAELIYRLFARGVSSKCSARIISNTPQLMQRMHACLHGSATTCPEDKKSWAFHAVAVIIQLFACIAITIASSLYMSSYIMYSCCTESHTHKHDPRQL